MERVLRWCEKIFVVMKGFVEVVVESEQSEQPEEIKSQCQTQTQRFCQPFSMHSQSKSHKHYQLLVEVLGHEEEQMKEEKEKEEEEMIEMNVR